MRHPFAEHPAEQPDSVRSTEEGERHRQYWVKSCLVMRSGVGQVADNESAK
ncbi:MAG: hypothetical protein P4L91_02135 [Burkholderiaceae bacterium]|nr:hypothetical protein [Burkholderiaceae bacterium]